LKVRFGLFGRPFEACENEAVELRAMTADDAGEIAETVRQGFESYRSWAPSGWEPPTAVSEEAQIRARLATPGFWGLVALEDGGYAGHVSFVPAREHPVRDPAPGVAHLSALFVRAPWWGTGLADRLHARFLEAAAAQGYDTLRLFTPAGASRARAFYERRAWEAQGEPASEPMLGLDLVEYRRPAAA
jgi:GNAT superfamily N-acetyltransferase